MSHLFALQHVPEQERFKFVIILLCLITTDQTPEPKPLQCFGL